MDLVTLETTSERESVVTFKGTVYYRGGRIAAKKFARDLSEKLKLPAWVNVKKDGKRVEVPVSSDPGAEEEGEG